MESSPSCPTISVVIPCYNGEAYLQRCVESLLVQDNVTLEIIVIDDCSTDGSYDLGRAIQQQDGRCRIVRQAKNGGVSLARNTGLRLSRGKIVMFVDVDDWLFPDACRRLLEVQATSHSDLTLGGFDYVDESGRRRPAFSPRRTLAPGSYENIFQEHEFYRCQGMFDSSCGRLFRRKVIEQYDLRFPEKLKFGEDACFVLDYLAHASRVAVLGDRACYAYLQHDVSCVHQLDIRKRLTQLLQVVDYCRLIHQANGLNERVLLHKSKEILFSIKRYGGSSSGRTELLEWLCREHLQAFGEVLDCIVRLGKWKHRLLAGLIMRGHLGWAGKLLSQW